MGLRAQVPSCGRRPLNSNVMSQKITFSILFGLIAIFLGQFFIYDYGGIKVSFQSSDGEWADGEVIFKGRNFETALHVFEKYKSKCNKPEVTLQRTTKEPTIFRLSYWIHGVEGPIWEIPYSTPHPNLKGEAVSYPPCFDNWKTKIGS